MFNVFIFSWCPSSEVEKDTGQKNKENYLSYWFTGGVSFLFPPLSADWEKVMLAIPTLMCSTMVAPAHRCCSGEGGGGLVKGPRSFKGRKVKALPRLLYSLYHATLKKRNVFPGWWRIPRSLPKSIQAVVVFLKLPSEVPTQLKFPLGKEQLQTGFHLG